VAFTAGHERTQAAVNGEPRRYVLRVTHGNGAYEAKLAQVVRTSSLKPFPASRRYK
jgi:hypothetical protein